MGTRVSHLQTCKKIIFCKFVVTTKNDSDALKKLPLLAKILKTLPKKTDPPDPLTRT